MFWIKQWIQWSDYDMDRSMDWWWNLPVLLSSRRLTYHHERFTDWWVSFLSLSALPSTGPFSFLRKWFCPNSLTHVQRYSFVVGAVWPDMAKFRHRGKILEVFGISKVYLVTILASFSLFSSFQCSKCSI